MSDMINPPKLKSLLWEEDEPILYGTLPASPTFQPANNNAPFAPMPNTIAPALPQQAPAPGLSLLDSSTQWSATTGSVGDDERVSEQLNKLLAANSPYVQQARAGAAARANERGLLNSSLAAGAGEEAAIAQSLPIAQQDAATFNKQNLTNQTAQNAAGQFNADAGFKARQLGEQARQFDNDAQQKQQALIETARQFDTDAGLKARTLLEQQRQFDNDQLSKLSMFNRETASKEQMAQLDASTKTYLAKTEAEYKTLMQSSASAAQMYQTYQQEVTRILNSKDLDQPNKQHALDLLQSTLKDGMSLIGYVGNLDLAPLLNFAPGGGAGGAPAPLPSTNTAPGAAPAAGAPAQGGRYPVLATMYQQYLGREADAGGVAAWEQTIDAWFRQGMTGEQINARLTQEFQNSPEGQARGPNPAPYAPPAGQLPPANNPPAPAPAPIDPMRDPSRNPDPNRYSWNGSFWQEFASYGAGGGA